MQRDVHTLSLQAPPATRPEAGAIALEQQWLNRLMGNFTWMDCRLARLAHSGERILELGAGRGDLGFALAARGSPGSYAGVDHCPRPAGWPEDWAWWATDPLDFQHYDRFPVVTANLFLHRLSPEELAALGRTLRRSARVILATTPARRKRHLWQLAVLGAMGLSRTTRRFARAGVRAGFVGNELPQALGLSPRDWTWTISLDWRGAYRMEAVRRPRLAARA